jgi:hypothetical protein
MSAVKFSLLPATLGGVLALGGCTGMGATAPRLDASSLSADPTLLLATTRIADSIRSFPIARQSSSVAFAISSSLSTMLLVTLMIVVAGKSDVDLQPQHQTRRSRLRRRKHQTGNSRILIACERDGNTCARRDSANADVTYRLRGQFIGQTHRDGRDADFVADSNTGKPKKIGRQDKM